METIKETIAESYGLTFTRLIEFASNPGALSQRDVDFDDFHKTAKRVQAIAYAIEEMMCALDEASTCRPTSADIDNEDFRYYTEVMGRAFRNNQELNQLLSGGLK